jgi:hypothetical protein
MAPRHVLDAAENTRQQPGASFEQARWAEAASIQGAGAGPGAGAGAGGMSGSPGMGAQRADSRSQ